MAVKCMEQYISQQEISETDKEVMKQNHKQWAEMVLQGVKQRLHECGNRINFILFFPSFVKIENNKNEIKI